MDQRRRLRSSQTLLQLTFLSPEEIDDLVTEHDQHPENRLGQRTLAKELTTIVHGEQAAASAAEASDLLFDPSADISAVSQSAPRIH